MNREEARAWYVNALLEKVRKDPYPSTTQMAMLEDAIAQSPEHAEGYMEVLIEKVANENFPSVSMLQRIQRVAESLPR